MPTGSDFALVTDKKLLGVRDFDLWLLKYLRDYVNQSVKRLFIQGSFLERMPLSSPGANQVQVDPKPTLQDGFAHDGAGHILDLGQIDTSAAFANVTGQTYEVGASYVEYPVGIRTNPRTGKFEYDHMREGIGVSASPDQVTIDGSTLTFVVDALFEQGVSPANHTGRQVRVFVIVPGDTASSDAIAIETCDVFYDGGMNKITTTGLLGQTAPNVNASVYVVQLVGVTVLMDSADNRPTELPESVFFIGTVLGNGGTPSAFDITGQKVIQSQAADQVTVDPLPDWFDGSSNPGGTVQEALEKIVHDLATVIEGDLTTSGAHKIGSAALPDWFDGTSNPSDSTFNQVHKIVSDLAEIGGDGSISGSQKISALDLGSWPDGTSTGPGSVQQELAGIVGALVSETDERGAGKITTPDLPAWADSTPNPASRLSLQLADFVTKLTSVTDGYGAGKITAPPMNDEPYSVAGGRMDNVLSSMWFYFNSFVRVTQATRDAAAVQSLHQVYVNPTTTIVDIAHSTNSLGSTAVLVAVGDNDTLLSRLQGEQWASRTPADGFSSGIVAVCNGSLGWAWAGNGGWIQTSTDGAVWTTRKFLGNNFCDIAVKTNSPVTYCAVGEGGYIWTSTNLTTWTQRTGATGMTTDDYVGIEYSSDLDLFVVTTSTGKIMTSPDGVTWTQSTSGTLTGTSPKYLNRMIQYSSKFGFVAIYNRNTSEIGIAHSVDGITWTITTSSTQTSFDEPNVRLVMMDNTVVYLSTLDDTQPYSLNAIVAHDTSSRPNHAGGYENIFDIAECFPFGARNVNGTLYVVGRRNNGDGVILSGAPTRVVNAF